MARTLIAPRPFDRLPLGDGRTVAVRPIDAADAAALLDFYGRLSPDSHRLRFHGSCHVTESQALRFASADEHPSVGFVAVLNERGPSDGQIVGHLCLEPAGERVLEVAVAVEDPFQGRGVGRALLALALERAERAGAERLQATMFVGNAPIFRLLSGCGRPYEVSSAGAGLSRMEIWLTG